MPYTVERTALFFVKNSAKLRKEQCRFSQRIALISRKNSANLLSKYGINTFFFFFRNCFDFQLSGLISNEPLEGTLCAKQKRDIEKNSSNSGYYIPRDEKSISRLDRMFELSFLLSFSTLKDIVFVEKRQLRGLEHRFGLIHAIRKSVEVLIEYHKFDNPPAVSATRRLQPYALREFRHRWYLFYVVGKDCSSCVSL